MNKTFCIAVLLLLACLTASGQSSYKGLTPGKSTRAQVERVLGQPVNNVSATLIEYRPQPLTGKIFVQYRPGSLVVERIEFLCRLPDSNCNDLMKSLNLRLPERAEQTSPTVDREYVAYSAAPFYVAETIDEDGEIINDSYIPVRVAFYSRELYEAEIARVQQAGETDPSSIYFTGSGGGLLNAAAIVIPEPAYPAAARAIRASGKVVVQATVDEQGRVVEAAAVSGHPLLGAAAEDAARRARFNPASTRRTGRLIYTFEPQ